MDTVRIDYHELNSEEPIELTVLDDIDAISSSIRGLLPFDVNKIVFLLSCSHQDANLEIYITDNPRMLLCVAETWIVEKQTPTTYWNIQEHDSFSSAYEVAKYILEGHELAGEPIEN
jgi:hypothetical protein